MLCHFVLRYRCAGAPDVPNLAARFRKGGRLSLMDVNPDGRVLRALINGGPDAAVAELGAERAAVETFQTDARKVTWTETAVQLKGCGFRLLRRYGNRIANDLLTDDIAKHDPAYFRSLADLELNLCDREPFNRIGFAWQLLAERP